MQGVDLNLFQFDHDLAWAAVLLNRDGTIYGRYGSRDARGPMHMNSMDGLKRTLERALDLHKEHPKHRDLLAGKRGPKPKYAKIDDYPVDFVQQVIQSDDAKKGCIHCHNVHEAQMDLARKAGSYDPNDYYRYPSPLDIGLDFDVKEGVKITKVERNSPASKAGLKRGDVIEVLGGQHLISTADVQWVLHHHPKGAGKLEGIARRKQKELPFALELDTDWRQPNLSWRNSMYYMPPKPGLWVQTMDRKARAKHRVSVKKLGLMIRGVYGRQVKRAGLRKGDVIIAVDGQDQARTDGEFHEYLRLNHWKPGSKVRLRVLRGSKKVDIAVTF